MNDSTINIETVDPGCDACKIFQSAIDGVASRGGGTVRIPSGMFHLSNALRLRTGVRIVGSEGTILTRVPSVASPLVDRVGYGHYEFTVEDPDLFSVGDGVHIHDDKAWGFYTTVGTLVGRKGPLLFIDRPFAHDYSPKDNGVAVRLHSVIEGVNVSDAAIENIILDGNLEETRLLDGCRGAGLFLLRADRVAIRNVEIRNYRGDGISFQQCTDVFIQESRIHHNSGVGIHPGSGSVRYVIAGNEIHDNGSYGIYYCLRSTHSDCSGNRIVNNGEAGISIGDRDTHHLIRNNLVKGHCRHGIEFRAAVHGGGDFVRMEDNQIGPNCLSPNLDHEIWMCGNLRSVVLARNTLTLGSGKKSAVWISAGCKGVVLSANKVCGESKIDIPDLAASEPLPEIGPSALPQDGARHLNIELLPPWTVQFKRFTSAL